MDIIEELIRELGSEDENVRMYAGERLISIGQEAVKPLIEALEDFEHPARHMIAATLGYIGDKRATPALIKALKDKDHLVRLHAAAALGKLKDIKALEPLIHALFDATTSVEKDPLTNEPLTVRAAAAQSLGELGDRRAVPALIAALSDQNRGVRTAVIQALMRIGDERAVEPLAKMLQAERDESECLLIVKAIGHIGGEKAKHILKELSEKHKNENIAKAASEALSRLTQQPHVKPTQPQFQKGDHSYVKRKAIAPVLSASMAASALLLVACAIYWVVEHPTKALFMFLLSAVLAISAGLITSIWHKRERLHRLEFTLKRSKAKNKCT
jgi:HEAT repeat protein